MAQSSGNGWDAPPPAVVRAAAQVVGFVAIAFLVYLLVVLAIGDLWLAATVIGGGLVAGTVAAVTGAFRRRPYSQSGGRTPRRPVLSPYPERAVIEDEEERPSPAGL